MGGGTVGIRLTERQARWLRDALRKDGVASEPSPDWEPTGHCKAVLEAVEAVIPPRPVFTLSKIRRWVDAYGVENEDRAQVLHDLDLYSGLRGNALEVADDLDRVIASPPNCDAFAQVHVSTLREWSDKLKCVGGGDAVAQ